MYCHQEISCNCFYSSSCYDDTAFARAVIDYVSEHYCVDAASIHLQGHKLFERMLGLNR